MDYYFPRELLVTFSSFPRCINIEAKNKQQFTIKTKCTTQSCSRYRSLIAGKAE